MQFFKNTGCVCIGRYGSIEVCRYAKIYRCSYVGMQDTGMPDYRYAGCMYAYEGIQIAGMQVLGMKLDN